MRPHLRNWRLWLAGAAVGLVLVVGSITVASNMEKQEGFCASCHTEPESTYQARFETALSSGSATDLASFHHRKLGSDQVNIRCIDCHVGEGVAGRGVVLTLAAFDALKYYTHTAHQPAQIIFTIQNQGCAKCHADAVSKLGFENHYHNKLLEPGAPYERCVDCHLGHQLGSEQTRFVFQKSMFPVCEDCHRQEHKGPTNMGLGR